MQTVQEAAGSDLFAAVPQHLADSGQNRCFLHLLALGFAYYVLFWIFVGGLAWSHYVAQAVLHLSILLPQPPEIPDVHHMC